MFAQSSQGPYLIAYLRSVAWLVLLLAWPNSPTIASDFTGKVVGVLDGDTIEVIHNGRAERIRLSAIDYPEKGQAYGRRAKQATSELVFGKEVTVKTFGLDKYGRTIGDVTLPDGTVLNQEQARADGLNLARSYTTA